MTSIRNIIIVAGLFVSLNLLHAQTAMVGSFNRIGTPIQTAPPDSIVAVTAESQGLSLVAPEDLPFGGTFWEVMPGGIMAPLPCPPIDQTLPIYAITDTAFLVDATGGQVTVNTRQLKTMSLTQTATSDVVASALDTQATAIVDLINQVQTATANQQVRTMAMAMGVPSPGGDGGTNSYTPNGASFTIPDYGTNLWIAQWNMASGSVTGIASNTLADVSYDLLTNVDLTTTNWGSTGLFFVGSETANWTPLPIISTSLTNNCFFRLRSWASSDGSGLPDWWQEQYFGVSSGVDPYGNPAGDGYSNLQKFQAGMNPNQFYTPAAPQGLTLNYNANDNTADLNWLPVAGNVTGYTVKKTDYMGDAVTYPLSASTTSLADNNSYSSSFYTQNYSVQANYSGGNSAWNTIAMEVFPNAAFINGAQGYINLVLYNPPADLSAVKIFRSSGQYTGSGQTIQYWPNVGSGANYPIDLADGDFYIPAASFTNGIAAIPATQAFNFGFYGFAVQTVRSNGLSSSDWWGFANNNVFVDGRQQLKDNLRFRLRAATDNGPFELFQTKEPTNYVYAGFYDSAADFWPLNPFSENNNFRNLVYDANNLLTTNSGDITYNGINILGSGIGMPNTGAFYAYPFDQITIDEWVWDDWYVIDTDVALSSTPKWQADFSGFLTTNGLPTAPASVLTASLSQWLVPAWDWVIEDGVPDGYLNYYGLPSLSEMFVTYTNNQFSTSTASSGAPPQIWPLMTYLNIAQPEFQTDSYYFARPGTDPLPEQGFNVRPSPFSPTNTTPLLTMSVGNSIQIAGYAKLALQNGYPGVYGYLGQYFDKAYKMTNGVATTNTTGVLSPYGDFFATEPGPTALVAMPDIDPPYQRGTCTVYTVSAVIDRSQASNMDLSFNGANATSLNNPAKIWCNNNFDRGHIVDGSDFEQDDLSQAQIANLNVPAEQKVPDCQYKTNGMPAIPCTRDLEDYFRLWLPGMAAAMAVAPTNYTVQLTLSGDGQIRIFRAYETSGGTNYLFDETTASNQVAQSASLYVGILTSSSPVVLTNRTKEHFIICGAHTGSAQVDLQILDGNQNVVADAPAYLQINDIKNMYERWTVGDAPSRAPMNVATNADNDMPDSTPSRFQYTPPTDTSTPYILFVHGWNMESWEKDRYAEAAYKRLYWQGYHGRFGIYRWPTGNKISDTLTAVLHARNYDNSESNAWASATGLTNLLTQLNVEYPGKVYLMAHSMGNVVAGEALRRASSQLVNTYVAMQGAVPAHCYDAAATTRAIVPYLGLGYDDGTPNRYANYYTTGAPCYFGFIRRV